MIENLSLRLKKFKSLQTEANFLLLSEKPPFPTLLFKSSIKFKIGQNLKLKYVPKIKFKLSDEYQYYDKINRLLKNNG